MDGMGNWEGGRRERVVDIAWIREVRRREDISVVVGGCWLDWARVFWMSQSDAKLQGGKGNETDLGECIFGLYFVVVVVLESPELDQKAK